MCILATNSQGERIIKLFEVILEIMDLSVCSVLQTTKDTHGKLYLQFDGKAQVINLQIEEQNKSKTYLEGIKSTEDICNYNRQVDQYSAQPGQAQDGQENENRSSDSPTNMGEWALIIEGYKKVFEAFQNDFLPMMFVYHFKQVSVHGRNQESTCFKGFERGGFLEAGCKNTSLINTPNLH